jgi:hypothetical protein
MDYFEKERLLRVASDGPAVTLNVAKSGRHLFGGSRDDLSFSAVSLPKPIHHFLTLEVSDRLCPVKSDVFTRLPLIYPLLYGAGGGEIQYSVVDDGRIEVHDLSSCFENDPYVTHTELPRFNVSLRKIPYAQERLACALKGYLPRNRLSWLDRIRLRGSQNLGFFRMGGHFESCQGPIWQVCKNPRCDWRNGFGKTDNCSQIRPIAVFHATTHIVGKVWDQYSEDVEFYFGYCPHCSAIHAVNRCT